MINSFTLCMFCVFNEVWLKDFSGVFLFLFFFCVYGSFLPCKVREQRSMNLFSAVRVRADALLPMVVITVMAK